MTKRSTAYLSTCVMWCAAAACGQATDVEPKLTAGSMSSAGSVSMLSAGSLSTPTAGTNSRTQAGAAGSKVSAGSTAPPAAGSGGSKATAGTSSTPAAGSGGNASAEHFSFFVASYAAMQRLSGTPNGFGGDLRFGKADGLSGADEICRTIAETALPGAGSKVWHAFLSVTKGPDGTAVNAIDRVGTGPWYDRRGRLIAQDKTSLGMVRPQGADTAIINDLPNEDGVPNHAPDGMQVDNHDILTGSSATGTLYKPDWSVTCHDWTSAVGSDGKPRVGHAWPRGGGGGTRPGGGGGGENWMSALDEAGCGAGASLVEMGPPNAKNPTVGSGGGYGGIYCFALSP